MRTEKYTLITCPEIRTMDDGNPTAEAVCISGGKILAVGTLEALRAAAPHPCEEIHLKEGVLLPGFIDSHSHLSMYAQCRTQFFCDTAHGSIGNLLAAFRGHAATQTDSEWILGYCYDETAI